jgi:deoxyribonuclease (pyrimidine dimer)
MTRINLVPPNTLSGKHLVAEWRELPRVFALAHKASLSSKPWTNKQPKNYLMGEGHVIFFYDKLSFLAERHESLTQEMLARGYKPSQQGSLRSEWGLKIPQGYWKGYVPTEEAVGINMQRIAERIQPKGEIK